MKPLDGQARRTATILLADHDADDRLLTKEALDEVRDPGWRASPATHPKTRLAPLIGVAKCSG